MQTIWPRVGNRKVLLLTINSSIYAATIYRVLECIVRIVLTEEMRMKTSGNILCLSAPGRSEMKEECDTKM
jgi:hypothetical protein